MPDRSDDDLTASRQREEVQARVTTPLLTLITRQSLDEDYLAAARRHRADGSDGHNGHDGGQDVAAAEAHRGRPHLVTAVAVAVFGVLVATAGAQTSRNAGVQDASRESLIAQIEAQRDRVAAEQRQVASLRDRTTSSEQYVAELTQDEQVSNSQLQRLRARTGFIAVTGEGVRVQLDAAPDAVQDQQLRDSDVALMVNAWWSAGAEAIAVNGQRLTALSAIRTSGVAVEVNDVGVAPPFTIAVIGDQDTLQARFYETSSGLAFDDLARRYDFSVELTNADDLSLPAAPARLERLRSASTETGPPRNDPETS